MFVLKHLVSLLLASIFFVSCSSLSLPRGPLAGQTSATGQQVVPKTAEQIQREAKLKRARIKANAEAKARRDKLRRQKAAKAKSSRKPTRKPSSGNSSTSSSSSSDNNVVKPIKRDPVKTPKSRYRTASKIPGKSGYVFNPWTNKAVDVRGFPSGQLIRDPNDGDPSHKFRVP